MKRKEFNIVLGSLVVSILITSGKFTAYFHTHSVAILSDSLESIINVVAGSFACYSIYLTHRPRDLNHPYGHGKVEFFSIGFEGSMIFIAGCLILFEAADHFIHPQQLSRLGNGIALIAITGGLNWVLGLYLRRQGRRLPSITIEGNGQHILTDAWSSLGLLAALFAIHLTSLVWIDPLASLLLGILILVKGYSLIRKSVSGLMDETDMKKIDQIVEILETNRRPQWIDIHNMRVQQYGNNFHVDCHITMPYYYTLEQVHREIKDVAAIADSNNREGEMEFFIHTDPCVEGSCKYCLLNSCSVRRHPFIRSVRWTRENVMPNVKHTALVF